MLTKEQLRYTDSNFYKSIIYTEEPYKHVVTDEDIFDPGRVTFIYGMPFSVWNIIMRFNMIVDPMEDMVPGMVLLIPTLKELRKLELA